MYSLTAGACVTEDYANSHLLTDALLFLSMHARLKLAAINHCIHESLLDMNTVWLAGQLTASDPQP